jgi:hypothetical protein
MVSVLVKEHLSVEFWRGLDLVIEVVKVSQGKVGE